MSRRSSAVVQPVLLPMLLPVLLGACVSQTTALEVTVPPTTETTVGTSLVPATTSTVETTSTTSTSSTTTTSSTSTSTSTTTVVATTTTVAAASLPPIGEVASVDRSNGDAAMPIDVRLPVFAHRPAATDLAASWAAVVEDEFSVRARALIAQREAEASATTTSTTTLAATTTVPVPPPPPPQLTIGFELHPSGQGPALLRMVAIERLDGPPVTSTASFVVAADGGVVASRGVVASERFGDLAALLRSALGDRAGDWTGISMGELLADVEPGDAGGLRVRVAPSLLSQAGDPAVVDIAPADAAPLLRRADAADAAADGADCDVVRCVALTFDDGPTTTTTRLLDVLDHARAPASFFVVGASVERHPDIARRIVASGHDIGNHTWTHRRVTALSPEQVADELARTDAAIVAATGVQPAYFRPPYGRYDLQSRYVDYGFAMWDVDPRDWDHRRPAATVQRSLAGVGAGSVIVLHDIHDTTVDAMAVLVAELRADGFTPATMSQMFGTPEAGAVYRSQADVEPPPPSTTTTTTTTTVASP